MARRTDIFGVVDATGSIFAYGAITVTDAATKIPTTNLDNRKAITIFNNSSSETVYIGGSSVTTSTGYPLLPYQGLPFDLGSGGQLYGICNTGKTASVRYLEIDNS